MTDSSTERGAAPPPIASIEAEEQLLGAVLLGGAWERCADRVAPFDFHKLEHKLVARAIAALAAKGAAIDAVTVSEHLSAAGQLDKVGSHSYLAELAYGTTGDSNLEAYADIVRDRADRRRLQALGVRNAADLKAPVAELVAAQRAALDAIEDAGAERRKPMLAGDAMRAALIAALSAEREPPLPTGFADLDERVQMRRGDLVVLAARPSMGKTALAMCAAFDAARADRKVAVVSLEQPREQLMLRELARQSKVPLAVLLAGIPDADPKAQNAARQAAERCDALPLAIDDNASATVADVRRRAEAMRRMLGGLDVVVVDYLQLLAGEAAENRTQAVAAMTRELKATAKTLGAVVLLLSQLNREPEQRADKRPLLADLRDSGAIEQDADVVLFIYRDEVYNTESADKGCAELHVAKNRNGPVGTVKLAFDAERTAFADFTSRTEDSQWDV